jgi:ABC-2 type transport system permease protein
VLKLIRRAYAIFKAYALSDLVRSKGFVYGLISFSIWILLFMSPLTLFMDPQQSPQTIAAYSFTAILIFMFYGAATWDWAAELRWMINDGRLEYYIASGSGFLPHYLGILPISLIWVFFAMIVNYVVLSIVWGPPALAVIDISMFIYGLTLLIINLIAYALILGGTIIASGVSGFVMEIISYSMLGWFPVIEFPQLIARGMLFAIAFLTISLTYFRYQIKKILREGTRATALW